MVSSSLNFDTSISANRGLVKTNYRTANNVDPDLDLHCLQMNPRWSAGIKEGYKGRKCLH